MYYVALNQFDYLVPGRTAFNSLVKAINFINKKGQVGRSYLIEDNHHHDIPHVVLDKRGGNKGYKGLEKSNNVPHIYSNTLYGYDTRMNDVYDPYRIDPSSVHLY